MKMALIGGGSLRTPYFVESLVKYASKLGVTQLMIMDNDEEKLQIFGGLSVYLAKKQGTQVDIQMTCDPVQAIRDAEYVVTTLRVGQDIARIYDEKLALAKGVIGQETTGAGGFAYAVRTIPVMLSYMELVKKYAKPGAIVFNFTNPSGLVTQAMVDAGYDNIIGICDNATGMKIEMGKTLELNPSDFFVRVYGLNHLSWGDRVEIGGKDILPALMKQDAFVQNYHEFSYFDRELIRRRGTIPNGYLYYYYHQEKALYNLLHAPFSRGESIYLINQQMLNDMRKAPSDDFETMNRIYREAMGRREGSYMAVELGGKKDHLESIDVKALGIPALAGERGQVEVYEGYAGIVFNYIQALHTGVPVDIVLSVPGKGAVAGMEADDVLEISCMVDREGAHPIVVNDPDEDNLLLMRQVKRYEKLTVQAVKEKSKGMAAEALMANPLVGSWSIAKELIKDYWNAHSQYLEGWHE